MLVTIVAVTVVAEVAATVVAEVAATVVAEVAAAVVAEVAAAVVAELVWTATYRENQVFPVIFPPQFVGVNKRTSWR
jgi:hypothetical protein